MSDRVKFKKEGIGNREKGIVDSGVGFADDYINHIAMFVL